MQGKEDALSQDILKASRNKFNNLESHKYDYEELERKLLGH